DAANARIDRGDRAAFAEYDLLHGLTGIGAHLLHHHPGSDALGRVLTYLVRLTRSSRVDGEVLPGWWVHHPPNLDRPSTAPGGHANLGLAHGITGPLALLALALRRGVTVPGHVAAIAVILSWLDRWRRHTDAGPWWPQWITRTDLSIGRPTQRGPGRPSWCYGTPGIARAQQLAAIATDDPVRRRAAEHALIACLDDPVQLARIGDAGLCHGWAGLHQTVWRAGADALTPHLTARLPHLRDELLRHHGTRGGGANGLLDGDAGVALALHTAARAPVPVSGWDACLLLT
ncbi:MAG TPA: lanthionine synthetase C family protein, partial [Actinoplanes sp.]